MRALEIIVFIAAAIFVSWLAFYSLKGMETGYTPVQLRQFDKLVAGLNKPERKLSRDQAQKMVYLWGEGR